GTGRGARLPAADQWSVRGYHPLRRQRGPGQTALDARALERANRLRHRLPDPPCPSGERRGHGHQERDSSVRELPLAELDGDPFELGHLLHGVVAAFAPEAAVLDSTE